MKKKSVSKSDIINSVITNTSLSHAIVLAVINSMVRAIKKEIEYGNDILIHGFASFTRGVQEERTQFNPLTSKRCKVKKMYVLRMKASSSLKKACRTTKVTDEDN